MPPKNPSAESSLLDDLEAEKHREAIESGNLHRRLEPMEIFQDAGYFARIRTCQCSGCGSFNQFLLGVFHRQVGTKGSIRDQAMLLGPITDDLEISAEIEDTFTERCPGCVNSAWHD